MKIPWKLKKLLITVFGEDRVKNRKVFSPDFSDGLFPTASSPGASRDEVVAHFLSRQRPRFFVDCDDVMPLVAAIRRDHPDWEDGIVKAARATCDEALQIYHMQAPPLNAQFPWGELKRGPYDDQLFISRPQRFGFAPVLAQAALFDESFLQPLDDMLAGWQKYAQATPYRWPYNSNHAVVYRVIALCWCWLFVSAIHARQSSDTSRSVLYNILAILKNDVLYLGPNLGNSHPNNHLLADYFVGWLLQHMFPELIPETMDFSGYEDKWQAELQQQFYLDGGSFEHAVHYHEHGCELLMIYRLLAPPDTVSLDLDQHIGRILRFQASLNGPLCRPWALGDTTEDTLLPLDASFGWSSQAILAVHNQLYPGQALPFPDAKLDQKAFWLLSGQQMPIVKAGKERSVMENYPDSGFVYWRNCAADSELLLRTGVSPGAHFIQGHMHSDILSLYWRVGEVELLASSGTYSYKFEPEDDDNYRNYFCGPSSHSAVLIDNQDPLGALQQGFRRGDNGLRVSSQVYGDISVATFSLSKVDSGNCYDGFRRGILQLASGDSIVLDIFTEMQSALQVSTGWQFDELLHVTAEDGVLQLSSGNEIVAQIVSTQEANAVLHKGEVSPLLGWQSTSYGVKSATYYARYLHPLGTRFAVYALTSSSGIIACELDDILSSNECVVVKLRYQSAVDVVYINLGESAPACNICGFNFVFRVAVHSQRDDGSDRILAVDCAFTPAGAHLEGSYSPGENLLLEKTADSSSWVKAELEVR
jgi:hypothetical protein